MSKVKKQQHQHQQEQQQEQQQRQEQEEPQQEQQPPPHSPPRRLQHRRSSSWSAPSISHLRLSPSPRSSPPQEPGLLCPQGSPSEGLDSHGRDLQCPPLHLLTVSKRPPSDRSRLINKIRNGADMKLDIEAVEKASQDWDDAHGGDSDLQRRKERMALCDKECSRILSYLFLGGRTVAQSLSTLRGCRITHVINCVGFVCPDYFPNDFYYKTLWLQDSPNEDIVCVLYDVFDFIENAREQSGGRVFLHCCQGVSRSAALAIAYLMWRKHKCFEDAFEEVKLKRSVASPNMGFAAQLMQWQSKILDPPDRQASQIYRVAPHSMYDPLFLVPKAVGIPQMQDLDSRGAFVINVANRVYVWRGRQCDKQMVAVADHAAFQLVRYERAQGPIMSVREGNEPSHLKKALRELYKQGSNEGAIQGGQTEHGIAGYDSDYEMYRKAKSGEYAPPIVGSGVLIHLPARDEKWSQLRTSFMNSPRP